MLKLCIPHPCDELNLKLLEKYDKVVEVYLKGPTSRIGTGRIGDYNPSSSDFRGLCKEIHDRGCEVNVLLNAPCFGGEEYTKKWIRKTLEYLDRLSSMDVEAITLADPYLSALIRHYGFSFKTVVSVLAFVLTPVRARYFDEMEVDRITLATDLNRDVDTIKQIRKAVRCKLGVIVNEGCLLHCPYRHVCYNYIAHVSMRKERSIVDDSRIRAYHWIHCNMIRKTQPYKMLTSPWIRPENLIDYERLGIEYFKISGRNKPCIFLEKSLEAYHSGHFEGNIFEILDGGPRLPDAWSKNPTGYVNYGPTLYYLDNKDLDVFFKKVSTCSKNCPECGFCEEFAKKHLKENEEVSEVYRQLSRDARLYHDWVPRRRGRSLLNLFRLHG